MIWREYLKVSRVAPSKLVTAPKPKNRRPGPWKKKQLIVATPWSDLLQVNRQIRNELSIVLGDQSVFFTKTKIASPAGKSPTLSEGTHRRDCSFADNIAGRQLPRSRLDFDFQVAEVDDEAVGYVPNRDLVTMRRGPKRGYIPDEGRVTIEAFIARDNTISRLETFVLGCAVDSEAKKVYLKLFNSDGSRRGLILDEDFLMAWQVYHAWIGRAPQAWPDLALIDWNC